MIRRPPIPPAPDFHIPPDVRAAATWEAEERGVPVEALITEVLRERFGVK